MHLQEKCVVLPFQIIAVEFNQLGKAAINIGIGMHWQNCVLRFQNVDSFLNEVLNLFLILQDFDGEISKQIHKLSSFSTMIRQSWPKAPQDIQNKCLNITLRIFLQSNNQRVCLPSNTGRVTFQQELFNKLLYQFFIEVFTQILNQFEAQSFIRGLIFRFLWVWSWTFSFDRTENMITKLVKFH